MWNDSGVDLAGALTWPSVVSPFPIALSVQRHLIALSSPFEAGPCNSILFRSSKSGYRW